ncbi:hypothetical protein BA894_11440 [Vibrio natriegens]|uniref:hypothetical protein n=1 Tax=Vibrio natriegens TaxID=691 RepID=UPI00080478C9|nr:hypothetical protein [Vibrio natriegens]ANQ27029.1 hypothetical protein BA894_11440 [Vibrio natriegens]
MEKVHIGYDIPNQEFVYIERYYNDDGTEPVKTIITCPSENWSYNMDFLTEDEFELLIDRDEPLHVKEDIYLDNLGSEVASYFECF